MTGEIDLCENKNNERRKLLRNCMVRKSNADQTCGFHLSRSPWDPYPWVSNVEDQSPASTAGLQVGDFVIEVNEHDILGLNIDDIATKVRRNESLVKLLVWKSNISETEKPSPAAFNLQKFSHYVEATLQLIECPVCLGLPTTPTLQCSNGHILCSVCRTKTAKCPLCRAVLANRGRCLLAEKIHRLFRETFATKRTNTQPITGFPCPWIGSHCRYLIKDTKHLWKHIQEIHKGPIIKYYTRNQKISCTVPLEGCAIVLENNEGHCYCLRVRKHNFTVCRLAEKDQDEGNFWFSYKSCLRPISSIWDSWENIENVNGHCKLPNDMHISFSIIQFDENKNKMY